MAGPDWRTSSWTADWYARDSWETALGPDFYKGGVFERRYGGDLQGVLDKLDYLKDLGINALYFNPLFYANVRCTSTMGIPTITSTPTFGPDPKGDSCGVRQGNQLTPRPGGGRRRTSSFSSSIKEAHARGMKVIIDGVFNHTGRDFFAFRDVAEKQERSAYKGWYVMSLPSTTPTRLRNEFDYKGWWGLQDHLPVFRFGQQRPRRRAWDRRSTSSTPPGAGWTPTARATPPTAVDGWRLDAADERPVHILGRVERVRAQDQPERVHERRGLDRTRDP